MMMVMVVAVMAGLMQSARAGQREGGARLCGSGT